MTFIGNPIDYVVFRGLSEGQVQEVVLVEVKTGKSKRSSRQKQIAEAVQGQRVRFELIKLKDPLPEEEPDASRPEGDEGQQPASKHTELTGSKNESAAF